MENSDGKSKGTPTREKGTPTREKGTPTRDAAFVPLAAEEDITLFNSSLDVLEEKSEGGEQVETVDIETGERPPRRKETGCGCNDLLNYKHIAAVTIIAAGIFAILIVLIVAMVCGIIGKVEHIEGFSAVLCIIGVILIGIGTCYLCIQCQHESEAKKRRQQRRDGTLPPPQSLLKTILTPREKRLFDPQLSLSKRKAPPEESNIFLPTVSDPSPVADKSPVKSPPASDQTSPKRNVPASTKTRSKTKREGGSRHRSHSSHKKRSKGEEEDAGTSEIKTHPIEDSQL